MIETKEGLAHIVVVTVATSLNLLNRTVNNNQYGAFGVGGGGLEGRKGCKMEE